MSSTSTSNFPRSIACGKSRSTRRGVSTDDDTVSCISFDDDSSDCSSSYRENDELISASSSNSPNCRRRSSGFSCSDQTVLQQISEYKKGVTGHDSAKDVGLPSVPRRRRSIGMNTSLLGYAECTPTPLHQPCQTQDGIRSSLDNTKTSNTTATTEDTSLSMSTATASGSNMPPALMERTISSCSTRPPRFPRRRASLTCAEGPATDDMEVEKPYEQAVLRNAPDRPAKESIGNSRPAQRRPSFVASTAA